MAADKRPSEDLLLVDPHLPHGGGVRLGTLVLIRWLAVAGQLLALAIVEWGLSFDAQPEITVPIVLLSALLNTWFSFRADSNTRMSDRQSAAHLAFDLFHLFALLFATGGLANPFSVLLLAPASVSASILGQRSTKFLIALSLVLVTGLAFTPFPLPWSGPPPEIPALLEGGIWVSLCFTMVFLALYMSRVGREGRNRARALAATQIALEREQRLAALGTLAAAAAHELGTPLGTIMLASRDLLDHWQGDDTSRIDLELIVAEATRCRSILDELRESRRAGDATHFTSADVGAILHEAAGPHENRGGVALIYDLPTDRQVTIMRTPELIHAVRNIVENAVGFARTAVTIRAEVTQEDIKVSIADDGPGFDPQVIRRLGEPYVTTRQPTPGKDGGLGLGLFIAKTLLERGGAGVSFANRRGGGAVVTIEWPTSALIQEILDDTSEPDIDFDDNEG